MHEPKTLLAASNAPLDGPAPMIHYDLFGRALDFYAKRGWNLIEVPWAIPTDEMVCWTDDREDPFILPKDQAIQTPQGALVGSAEQSFLHLARHGRLAPGQWMAITPCFREEPEGHTRLRRPYFMKLELFWYGDHTSLPLVGEHAQDFFKSLTHRTIMRVKPYGRKHATFDLNMAATSGDWVEIGTYAAREYDGHKWICGTGLAEPRFSSCL